MIVKRSLATRSQVVWHLLCLCVLTGCGSGSNSGDSASSDPVTAPPSKPASVPLSISGTPSTTVAVGAAYSFTPKASAVSGHDALILDSKCPCMGDF